MRVVPSKHAGWRENGGQGDVYWLAEGAQAGYTHPHVVIQEDALNHSRVTSVVVCALTSNMARAKAPGNVLLDPGEANLSRRSIVVVSQVASVEKSRLGEYIGTLSQQRIEQILAGMRFLERIAARPERE